MPRSEVEKERQKTIRFLDELPNQLILSSKPRGWNGIVTEYRHHSPDEIASPPMAQHLITLNCGTSYQLMQKLDGRIYEGQVIKGDIILTPAHCPSEWSWDSEVDVLHLCLEPALVAKVAIEAIEVDEVRVEVLNRFAAADLQIQHLGQLLLSELQNDKLANRLYAESLVNALAIHVIREYSNIEKNVRQYSGGLSKPKLQQAIAHIQTSFNQDLSLDEIAAQVNLSAYHFARLFKQSTGLAPHQFQIRYRVEQAKELLQAGQMTISEIATAVGFYDQSHLSRHFKRIVGVSPKVIQQESKNVLWISKDMQDRSA
ncbi:helix-turn-helix transcriptional regulator [Leptolyngbya sp. FACHB-671]|uniref:helix-turn-helix domain-containing protein n=1 Tax=Leptolyngbya sp. FACHB-671 TaxID=2692812 RepID=UPI001687A1CD|nr:AraC family transcriptional regulator [Leptolyngbya sp. FACHB-671]MBD2065955.1 helix-turn-helix transcriptional regulator [Leptolyngbya sp. FACHB-671]